MKDSELQVLDCGFLVSVTWISDFNTSRIPDSLNCITDSEAQDSRLHKQRFLGFRKSGLFYMGRYTAVFDQRGPLIFLFRNYC